MPDPVASALGLVASWAGRPVTHTRIKGGLSHYIARVETDDGDRWLLRVLDPKIAATGLGLPLDQEIANTVVAAETGVGARVLHELPGALILEYIDGLTLDAPAVRARIPKIAEAARTLHAGPRFANDFSIFRKYDGFVALCREHDLPMPDGFADWAGTVRTIEETLAKRHITDVPCHNDLLPENFLEARGRVRIVDYQLSGNNDPCFELGDIAAEASFDPDDVERLTRAYFGTHDEALIARVRLNVIMSNLTWTLWFVVHHRLVAQQRDFDYNAEAATKYAKATGDLTDPGFGSLMDAAGR
ncbi:phosphotransferase [Herbidospora sp. NEAU-GS84]|uniref:Phosphotransferase n=1 Tax=Herbidospora solisilvae TaxID=2696284 RepID=A0A7C9JEI1_9ACTN|nr:phosphotransferase [Herbidospora solisilvae]NAS25224.1 phosphotransferase [Herbidospora solisilvae]